MNYKNKKSGFSIVESVVSLAIFSFLLIVFVQVMSVTNRTNAIIIEDTKRRLDNKLNEILLNKELSNAFYIFTRDKTNISAPIPKLLYDNSLFGGINAPQHFPASNISNITETKTINGTKYVYYNGGSQILYITDKIVPFESLFGNNLTIGALTNLLTGLLTSEESLILADPNSFEIIKKSQFRELYLNMLFLKRSNGYGINKINLDLIKAKSQYKIYHKVVTGQENQNSIIFPSLTSPTTGQRIPLTPILSSLSDEQIYTKYRNIIYKALEKKDYIPWIKPDSSSMAVIPIPANLTDQKFNVSTIFKNLGEYEIITGKDSAGAVSYPEVATVNSQSNPYIDGIVETSLLPQYAQKELREKFGVEFKIAKKYNYADGGLNNLKSSFVEVVLLQTKYNETLKKYVRNRSVIDIYNKGL
ncbi:MAG: hypothetical protein KatS3mg068_1721 [Candidatus Sericytochromatia bacterium]|nr:MAG: hypothetical protein KatS3mg068_1721 [Candidatus Sericytochromatia bacterium]